MWQTEKSEFFLHHQTIVLVVTIGFIANIKSIIGNISMEQVTKLGWIVGGTTTTFHKASYKNERI